MIHDEQLYEKVIKFEKIYRQSKLVKTRMQNLNRYLLKKHVDSM